MPRPIRIEYQDAFYHVTNRGRDRGRRKLFHGKEDYITFFTTLAEAVERFQLVVHGYCIMTSHYHLLVQTPEGNLGRAMKYLNGVYTQRFNRKNNTDGPLFRGRYKAILVEEENYLLQLSRYIHRNPIETKRPKVERLEDYVWSSYPAYINYLKAPKWLYREKIYQMLGKKRKYQGYRCYVEQGVDEEIKQFYNRGNTASVIGGKEFVSGLKENKIRDLDDKILVNYVLPRTLTIERIIQLVASYFNVDKAEIVQVIKGPQKGRPARKIAMYFCQRLGDYRLKEIMRAFGLSHIGSVSFVTSQIHMQMKQDVALRKDVERVRGFIMENAI